MSKIQVISLGGSIIAPDSVDTGFLKGFTACIREYLNTYSDAQLVLVTGGGAPARTYQQAYREIVPSAEGDEQDWIGIAATRLNARLLKAIFHDFCTQDVVTNPYDVKTVEERVLIAAGWKPGFSTDFDAVVLAERLGAPVVINLSNIAKVYSDDPKTNPDAKPIDSISWEEFQSIVGEEWVPGKNAPFDPVATKRAKELDLTVIVAAGKNLDNFRAILFGETQFEGTVIGPSQAS
jgi:uridylate kinase